MMIMPLMIRFCVRPIVVPTLSPTVPAVRAEQAQSRGSQGLRNEMRRYHMQQLVRMLEMRYRPVVNTF
jgi:hypothetical protein